MVPLRRMFLVLVLATGCASPRPPSFVDLLKDLESPEKEKRVEAFQTLLRVNPGAARYLKPFAPAAPQFGYPVAAILYRMGEGDAVPLDIRARHYALFRWPNRYRKENVIMQAFIERRVRNDLLKAGRSAVRHLDSALRKTSKKKAVVDLMVLLDERAAVEHLIAHPDLPEARRAVEAVAGTTEVAEWWETHRNRDADEWIRSRCRRYLKSDLEAFARETGHAFPDAARAIAWWEENQDRRPEDWWADLFPDAGPSHLEPLYAALEGKNAASAHRLLERWTDLRFGSSPGPRRWRRQVHSPLLRLRWGILGYSEEDRPWCKSKDFPAVESLQDGGVWLLDDFQYTLSIYMEEEGTRVLVSEYASDNKGTRGDTRWHRLKNDLLLIYSELLASFIVFTIEELPARPAPETPKLARETILEYLRARIPESALALGYAGDITALKDLRQAEKTDVVRRALLLLDDPSGLKPGLVLTETEKKLIQTRCKHPDILKSIQ